MGGDDDFDPADDAIVAGGDENSLIVGGGKRFDPSGRDLRGNGIAELSTEFGDRGCVGYSNRTDVD